ncbi:MAG: hemin-binding protein [Verrucomicrobiaceae bacterium]|nr:hemin-binding protein [Verrucomicrobiaceae bacterium]
MTTAFHTLHRRIAFSAILSWLWLSPAAPRVHAQDAATLYIQEYRVQGVKQLAQLEVETAVYPFLGPGRTTEDIEQARAALEKAYHDKGFQTVSINVPSQDGSYGIIFLEAVEASVGRLRVRGSRYFDIAAIKRKAPSLAEGSVPDFNKVQRDMIALNSSADRRVTPELKPGVVPGTVDIDLKVEDKLPLHGSLELNNRYSPDTSAFRLNGALSYGNLWQLGHTLGFNFQIAPENLHDAEVFGAYYLAPLDEEWSVMLQATQQDSDVSTLSGTAVAGRGEIYGIRFMRSLPGQDKFNHSLSFGIDYKHFDEDVIVAGERTLTPITYYPFSVNYAAAWAGAKGDTDLNLALNFHTRGLGSDKDEFDRKRYNSTGSYLYLRGDLSHTHELPHGLQLFTRLQGQASSAPLVNSEQFAGGGLGSVRGYLESTALGDHGIFGTLELRSPSFITTKNKDKPEREWRVYGFIEGGRLSLSDPLKEQQPNTDMLSIGIGSNVRLFDHFNGSFDLGLPLVDAGVVSSGDVLLTFRLWLDF